MSPALIIAILQAAAPLIEAFIAELEKAGANSMSAKMAQDHIAEAVAHLQVGAASTN